MHQRRGQIPGRWAALMAVLLVAAQVVLAGAALWHHHDDGDVGHGDCTVCIAVASDKTDGLPRQDIAQAPLTLIGFIAAATYRDGSVAAALTAMARGPPLD
ncbi:MAG: hypothetical protein JSR77_18500 [Planctomycetes bacterium]|nr:hypothetical protein [Planctomycetota bacterium]